MQRRLALCLLFLVVAVTSVPAPGQSLPRIEKFSNPTVVINQGDRLKLSAVITGSDPAIKWIRNDEIVCNQASCDLDTAKWGLGDQKVVLVVFNSLGSQFVRYTIRVLARPPEVDPKTVAPGMVEQQNHVDTVRSGDLVVQIVSGIGYSYNRSKVQVIGNTPRVLTWRERLRTHPQGVLRFGKDQIEEHTLLRESIVSLSPSPTGQRALLLLKGKIRSRQLDGKDPRWSIIVSDYAQVDTDGQGDVIVEQDELSRGRYILTVLRGNARFVHTSFDDAGKIKERKVLNVPAGVSIAFRRTAPPDAFIATDAKLVGETMALSAPQYVGKVPFKASLGETQRTPANDLAKLTKAMEDALTKNDPILALELGIPVENQAERNFAFAYALGRAYSGVYLSKKAKTYLELARSLDKKNPGPSYELAVIDLRHQKWKTAIENLEAADDDDYSDEQPLYYYRGVSKYRLGSLLSARNAFIEAVWLDTHPSLTHSSKEFLERLDNERKLVFNLWGGGGSDSNPLRLANSVDPPASITVRKGRFYDVGGSLDYEAFRDAGSYLKLGLSMRRIAYLEGDFKELATVDQNLAIRFALALDEATDKPAARVFATPIFGTTMLGSERGNDYVVVESGVEFPKAFCEPVLMLRSSLNLDPLPTREDLIDLQTNEAQFIASERTKRVTEYGFNLCSHLGIKHKFGFDYFYHTLHMRNQDLYVENYKGHLVNLRYHLPLFRRISAPGKLAYKTRAYPDSTDSRADKDLYFDLALRWHWTPTFHADLFGSYQKNQSNRESASFNRNVFGLMFGLEM